MVGYRWTDCLRPLVHRTQPQPRLRMKNSTFTCLSQEVTPPIQTHDNGQHSAHSVTTLTLRRAHVVCIQEITTIIADACEVHCPAPPKLRAGEVREQAKRRLESEQEKIAVDNVGVEELAERRANELLKMTTMNSESNYEMTEASTIRVSRSLSVAIICIMILLGMTVIVLALKIMGGCAGRMMGGR